MILFFIKAYKCLPQALTVVGEEELTPEDIGLIGKLAASRGAEKVAEMVKELGVQDQG